MLHLPKCGGIIILIRHVSIFWYIEFCNNYTVNTCSRQRCCTAQHWPGNGAALLKAPWPGNGAFYLTLITKQRLCRYIECHLIT